MLEYLKLGDKIDYPTYNAIVYLLRKFKRLNEDLKLGNSELTTKYGEINIGTGLTPVGDNYILEDEVTITGTGCFKNAYYKLMFNIMDINLSGTVNRRILEFTGETGETGTFTIVIPTDSINADEVIQPDFTLEVTFDEHEYYTPLNSLNVDLTVDNEYIGAGETATVTALVTDKEDNPVKDVLVHFVVNGVVYQDVTDNNGEATWTYTGTGDTGKITVNVHGSSIVLYDYESIIMNVNRSEVTLGWMAIGTAPPQWLWCNYPVLIDWGDGETSKVNNPYNSVYHEYTDNETTHTIRILGEVSKIAYLCHPAWGTSPFTSITFNESVTTLGDYALHRFSNLTSVVLPETLVNISNQAFEACSSLTSISIPSSVTSIGNNAFKSCTNLLDYQLYWDSSDSIITYSSSKMPNNTNTIFTIPHGTTSLYTAKNYPSDKLVERPAPVDTLTVTSDKEVLSAYDSESATLTVLATGDNNPVPNVELDYSITDKYNNVLDSGTVTTDASGEATVTYTATGVGNVTITFNYRTLLIQTCEVHDYWKYDASVHSTEAEVVNWDLPTGDFEITAYIERGTGGAYLHIGTNSTSDRILFGHASSNSTCYLYCGTNSQTNGTANNVDHTLKVINGVAYYTVNGNTISQNAPTGLTRKLYQLAPWGNSKISNIRIKPL